MSQENVEVVRRAWEYEMFGRGGEDAVADFASDFVMNPVEESPSYGRAAIRDNFQRFASAWDNLQVNAEEFVDAGDRGLRRGALPGSGPSKRHNSLRAASTRSTRCAITGSRA